MRKSYFLSLLMVTATVMAIWAWGVLAADIPGLVLYLSFDEQDPVDSSANPAEVTVHGDLRQAVGQAGMAGDFDGATSIEVSDHDKLDGMEALTIEAWIKPEIAGEGMSIASKRIANQNSDSYNFFMWTGNRLSGRINASGDFWSITVFESGNWYHVAYVFDGNAPAGENQMMYVNGELESTGSNPNQTVPAGDGPLWISELDANRGFLWGGLIDELGIWEKALSEDEITLSMNGELKAMLVEPQGKLAATWGEIKG